MNACIKCGERTLIPMVKLTESGRDLFGKYRERQVGSVVKCARCLHQMWATADGCREVPRVDKPAIVEATAAGNVAPTVPPTQPRNNAVPPGDPLGVNWGGAAARK